MWGCALVINSAPGKCLAMWFLGAGAPLMQPEGIKQGRGRAAQP